MIDNTIAKKQIMRLGQMQGFPRDNPEALKELILGVQAADTEATAHAAISAMLETATAETRCPMPAQIRGWIWDRQNAGDTEAKKRTADCVFCGGTAMEIVEVAGYSGARTCRCRTSA